MSPGHPVRASPLRAPVSTPEFPNGRQVLPRPIMRARIARLLGGLAKVHGWQALINRLVPEHFAPFTIRNGDTIYSGDIGSFIDRQVYLFGGYETAQIACFLSMVPLDRRNTILDVGANAGTHSLAFARAFRAVHAFEPNPMLWAQFERNMMLNQLNNVRLHKLGLADRDEELMLHLIDKPNFGLDTFSTLEQYDLPLRPAARCPVRHGGNYIEEIGAGRVDALKIDVQGFEPEVLLGLADVLKRDECLIWCEVGSGTLTKVATIADLSNLVPFEFRCLQMASSSHWTGSSVGLKALSGNLPSGDYVLVPKSWGGQGSSQ